MIAGRPRFGVRLMHSQTFLPVRDTSSIHVLWSWYGAGKTHSLYYLQNRALSRLPWARSTDTGVHRVSQGNSGLHRSLSRLHGILRSHPFAQCLPRISNDSRRRPLLRSPPVQEPELPTALRLLAMGDPPRQQTAQRWLRGDMLLAAELRAVGITQRISNAQQATRILSVTFRLLSDAATVEKFHSSRLCGSWTNSSGQRRRGRPH